MVFVHIDLLGLSMQKMKIVPTSKTTILQPTHLNLSTTNLGKCFNLQNGPLTTDLFNLQNVSLCVLSILQLFLQFFRNKKFHKVILK